MECAALVVSIIAIIISVITAVWQGIHENRINKTTLESLYHQEIFKDYLIEKIPSARRYLFFDEDGKLSGINDLCRILDDMVFGSLYFFYHDRVFYDELKLRCDETIEYLVQLSQQSVSGTNQKAAMDEIQDRIKGIYSHIGRKYIKG